MSDDARPEVFERFLDLIKERHSCRRFRADPIPDGYVEKILEAARWAMSGANCQPWEFVVVRRQETIAALYETYQEHVNELNFWLEQRFPFELRHPGFRLEGTVEEQEQQLAARPGFRAAPAVVALLGDGRRQLASVSGASTPGRHQTHLTDALSNAATHIHLAAAALGLATQWVSIHIQEPFKSLLGVPPLLTLHSLIPIGYAEGKPGGSYRRKLEEIVHEETYDRSKYMTTEDVVSYLYQLRAGTFRAYRRSRGEAGGPSEKDEKKS